MSDKERMCAALRRAIYVRSKQAEVESNDLASQVIWSDVDLLRTLAQRIERGIDWSVPVRLGDKCRTGEAMNKEVLDMLDAVTNDFRQLTQKLQGIVNLIRAEARIEAATRGKVDEEALRIRDDAGIRRSALLGAQALADEIAEDLRKEGVEVTRPSARKNADDPEWGGTAD